MKNKNLHLTALLVLTINTFASAANTDVTAYPDEINEDAQNLSNEELKAKVCAMLAVLKCTFYKLEAILNQIDSNSPTCNQNNCYNDECNNDDCYNDDTDDCPSLEFPCCKEEACCNNNANLPINLNINCQEAQKV